MASVISILDRADQVPSVGISQAMRSQTTRQMYCATRSLTGVARISAARPDARDRASRDRGGDVLGGVLALAVAVRAIVDQDARRLGDAAHRARRGRDRARPRAGRARRAAGGPAGVTSRHGVAALAAQARAARLARSGDGAARGAAPVG